MCVCVCVCVFVFGQLFFVNIYLSKQYRHPKSIHFYIYPFKLLNRFHGIRRELVEKPPRKRLAKLNIINFESSTNVLKCF